MRVPEDDSRVLQCICSYAKTLKAYLGPEIASADNITRSPLYALGEKGGAPKIDRSTENLFLKAYWSDLLPHLKWTLACKGPMFRYRVVTDEKIKTVFLGNESYRGRAKDVRDDIVTYNSIGDLVGPDLDLVILRLGFLGYKNVAMPGILKEALMLRESAMKPTWIVEVPSSLFGYGHFSYNEDVGSYIERTFQVVNLVCARSETGAPHGVAGAEDMEEEVGLGPHTPDHMPQQRIQPIPRVQAPPEPEMPAASWGGSSYKSNSNSKFGKKRGGGPV